MKSTPVSPQEPFWRPWCLSSCPGGLMSVISKPTPSSTLPSPSLMELTLIDFKVAMRVAWTELDPTHHLLGCLFHLTQVLKPWHTVYLWPKKIRSMRRILSTILVAISQFLQTKSESNNRSVCSRALSIF